MLIASVLQHSQINCLKSVFLQTKATHFETIITTVNEVKSDKTKVEMNLFFVVFRVSVLLPKEKSKLIHNQCT